MLESALSPFDRGQLPPQLVRQPFVALLLKDFGRFVGRMLIEVRELLIGLASKLIERLLEASSLASEQFPGARRVHRGHGTVRASFHAVPTSFSEGTTLGGGHRSQSIPVSAHPPKNGEQFLPGRAAIVEAWVMDEPSPLSSRAEQPGRTKSALRQLGLVVHPTRRVETVLDEVGAWASAHGLTVGQVPVRGQTRQVADPIQADACDLLLAIGGDGTTLSALHAGAPSSRPVLGVACGSIGVLTSVSDERLTWALDQIATGRWTPVAVPGLDVAWGEGHGEVAINDLVIIRDGPGQVMVSIAVDGVLYARTAGDGLVVATPLGSSAYTMAAGGPILGPGAKGMAVTALADHAGSCPPLVAGNESQLTLTIEPGYGGVRYEVDGHRTAIPDAMLTVRQRGSYATLVRLAEEEPRLSGLRRRGLVRDSPRVLVRDIRSDSEGERNQARPPAP